MDQFIMTVVISCVTQTIFIDLCTIMFFYIMLLCIKLCFFGFVFKLLLFEIALDCSCQFVVLFYMPHAVYTRFHSTCVPLIYIVYS